MVPEDSRNSQLQSHITKTKNNISIICKGRKNMRELLSTGQIELDSGLVCLCFYGIFLERQMYWYSMTPL